MSRARNSSESPAVTSLDPCRDPAPGPLAADAVETFAGRGGADPIAFARALDEAVRAWPGTPAQRWWKWLVEAASAVGLRPKAIDASVAQAVELARRGVRLVTFVVGEQEAWLAVEGFRRGRFSVSDRGEEVRLTPKALAARLGYTDAADPVRWVVVEDVPAIAGHDVHGHVLNGHDEHSRESHGHDGHGPGGHAHPSPLARLLKLLRAERSDVWVVVVFAVFAAVLSLATPIAVEALVGTVAFGRFLQPVVVLSLLLFGFLAFGAAMRALQTFVAEIIQRRLFARVVSDLAYRLPRVRRDRGDGEYLPETVNRFFDVVTVQKAVASLLLDGVGLVVATLVGMAVLAFYHPWLLGFDAVLLVLMAFAIFALGRGAIASSIKESRIKYATASWVEDLARCRVAFAHGGAEGFAAHRMDRLATEYLKARKAHFRVLMRQVLFSLGAQAVAGTVLLGLGGWLVIDGQLTLGQLVAAELIVAVIMGAFAKLGKHAETFYDLCAAVDKLGHLFDLPTEDAHGVMSLPAEGPAALRCRGLGYAYPDGGAAVDGLELDIRPGETVAVYAPPGGGKSTLAEILFGLRRPTAGYLEFDGVDPRDVRPDEYRSHVALAAGAEVLDGTVTENVALDRPQVGTAEVREALREAGLLDALLALPDGLKTRLTPDGLPLSETQVRRLVLARALAGRPRLLVVDGLLDGMDDEAVDSLLATLPDAGRTTVVLTARRDLAGKFPRSVILCDSPLPLAGRFGPDLLTGSRP